MKPILLTFLYLAVVNAAVADQTFSVLWQRELACVPNSACRPGTMLVDSKSNTLAILGTSLRNGEREGEAWLWRIDPNGSIINKEPLGVFSKYEILSASSSGIKATVNPDNGGILRLKTDSQGMSLLVTDKEGQTQVRALGTKQDHSESIKFYNMDFYGNADVLFVGRETSNGILTRADLTGAIVWKREFNRGQVNILSHLAQSSDGNIYAVGWSGEPAGKMTLAEPTTVCLLQYDSNGELIATDFFEGGMAPWATSLPKVICLSSGILVVVYDKTKNPMCTEFYLKAYTPRMEPMYEKQVLKTEEGSPPACFDICAISENRLVLVAKVNYGDLKTYEYKADGSLLRTSEWEAEVGAGKVYVNYLEEKIFLAYSTRPKGNGKVSRIKVMALQP